MRKVFLFAFLLSTLSAFSQGFAFTKPDYKAIEKQIKDKKSAFYYPELLKRYHDSDSTLTLEQRRHLYYGYTFQKEYAPYDRSESEDTLREVMNRNKHTEGDLKKIASTCDQLLKENPFNLRAINSKIYACEQLRDEKGFKDNLTKMKILIEALISSGDGLSKETAFYVIITTHEYDLLSIIGLNFGGRQSLIEHYDYLEVEKNEHGIEGMYFDVTPCLEHLGMKYK